MHMVARDRGGEGCPSMLEARQQLAKRDWVEHGAGKYVCADLARFFEHGYRQLYSMLALELRQPQRRG
jgi:hypothetical protein